MTRWLAYHEKHLGDELLADEDEKKLLAALIAISTGVEDPERIIRIAAVGRVASHTETAEDAVSLLMKCSTPTAITAD